MSEEKRHYFRVDDEIILKFESISVDEFNQRVEKNKQKILPDGHRREILGLDVRLKGILKQIAPEAPLIAHALNLLNTKIDICLDASQGVNNEQRALFHKKRQKVSLGAGGLAFTSTKPYAVNSYLALEFIISPSFDYIHCCGQVVDCTRLESNYRIGVRFEGILDEDKEKLIRHTLNRQTEQLRAQRINAAQRNNLAAK